MHEVIQETVTPQFEQALLQLDITLQCSHSYARLTCSTITLSNTVLPVTKTIVYSSVTMLYTSKPRELLKKKSCTRN